MQKSKKYPFYRMALYKAMMRVLDFLEKNRSRVTLVIVIMAGPVLLSIINSDTEETVTFFEGDLPPSLAEVFAPPTSALAERPAPVVGRPDAVIQATDSTVTAVPKKNDQREWEPVTNQPYLAVPAEVEGGCSTEKLAWAANVTPLPLDLYELRTSCDLTRINADNSETPVTVNAHYFAKERWGSETYDPYASEAFQYINDYLSFVFDPEYDFSDHAPNCNLSQFILNTSYDPQNLFPTSQTYAIHTYYPCMANGDREIETLNLAAESTHIITLDDVFGADTDWETGLATAINATNPVDCYGLEVNDVNANWLTDSAFTLGQDDLIIYLFTIGACGEEPLPVPWETLTHLIAQNGVICEPVDPATLELPAGTEWDDLALRPTYGGQLFIPADYVPNTAFDYGHCGTSGSLINSPLSTSTAFTITWLDPANDRNQIRQQAAQVSSDWAIINDEQRVIDPTGVIEQALLALDPDLTGQNVRIVRRAECRFDFYATTLDGVTTEGSWVPKWGEGPWDEAEMTGYTMLMITGLNQAVTAEGQASSRSFGGASMEWTHPDGFWRQFYETSGFFGHLRLYGDDMGNRMYFPPIDDDCFALSSAVLDGELRSIVDTPTSATSREPECAPGENTEARTFAWGRVQHEGYGGLAPIEELVSDRCYWANRDDYERYEKPQETTTVTNTDITPLKGVIIGVNETPTIDQFIVARIGGPLDPDAGGPLTSHYCCDTPFSIGTYQWDGHWVLVDNLEGAEVGHFTSTEDLALAPILAINPNFEGCDLTKTLREPEGLNYGIIDVEINCAFAIPSTGIWFSETFKYPIVDGTGNDEGINNDTRAFFARGLADQLNEVLIGGGWFGHWFFEIFSIYYQDDELFTINRSTGHDSGGTGDRTITEVITFDVATGNEIKIEDLFLPGADWRTEFEKYAKEDQAGDSGCPWSREEHLSMQQFFWPTNQGLESKTPHGGASVCYSVRFLAPWDDLADIIDPNGPAGHFVEE